jgi:fructokinase
MSKKTGIAKKKPVFVGLGEILWDILPGKKRIGGAPANFALHSQSLGAEAKICSSIGNDELGGEIKNKLSEFNSITEYIFTNSYPTGKVDVRIDENGVAKYIIKENSAWDFISWNTQVKELARKCDAVCFGTLAQRNNISKETISDFLENTKPECIKVFDINLRQNYYSKKIIQNSLETANIVKLNESEIETLREMFNIEGTDKKGKTEV